MGEPRDSGLIARGRLHVIAGVGVANGNHAVVGSGYFRIGQHGCGAAFIRLGHLDLGLGGFHVDLGLAQVGLGGGLRGVACGHRR